MRVVRASASIADPAAVRAPGALRARVARRSPGGPVLKFDRLNLAALLLGVLVLAAGGPWLARQMSSLPGPSGLAARSEQRVVTLEVGGMTCEACVAAVKGQLETVPGVNTVDVRLREKKAFVVCEGGVGDTTLTAAVRRAGGGFVAEVVSR